MLRGESLSARVDSQCEEKSVKMCRTCVGSVGKMGFNITKHENICFQCFEHFLGYDIFIENLDVWFLVSACLLQIKAIIHLQVDFVLNRDECNRKL